MISAVNNRGLMRLMCFKGALNAGLFIVFLSRLFKGAPGKIFPIVDNLRHGPCDKGQPVGGEA